MIFAITSTLQPLPWKANLKVCIVWNQSLQLTLSNLPTEFTATYWTVIKTSTWTNNLKYSPKYKTRAEYFNCIILKSWTEIFHIPETKCCSSTNRSVSLFLSPSQHRCTSSHWLCWAVTLSFFVCLFTGLFCTFSSELWKEKYGKVCC